MRVVPIALLCAAAAAALALIVWRSGEAPRPAPAVVVAPPAASAPVASAAARLALPHVPPAAKPGASTAVAAAAKPVASAASPVRSVFALSSDHQALIHETLLASADHEQLEREPRDDAWASESERLIREALAGHGRAGDFDLVAVDCRQTICAIQAFSYGEKGQREWVDAMDELYKQTLISRFDAVNTAFPNQGTRSPVLTFLHRRAETPRP